MFSLVSSKLLAMHNITLYSVSRGINALIKRLYLDLFWVSMLLEMSVSNYAIVECIVGSKAAV
jgi:hypothetical protein